MKNNCLTEELIARYAEGIASESEHVQIINHCRKCKECTNEIISTIQYLNQSSEITFPLETLFFDKKNSTIELKTVNQISMDIPLRVASMDNLQEHSEDILNHKEIIRKIYKSSSKDICAIRAQKSILNDFNIPISDKKLITEAIDNGWYVPGKGTLLTDTGKLLELHGIRTEIKFNVTIEDIIKELQNGNRIIVGIDSGELWAQTPDEILKEKLEDIDNPRPDHVLIVIDIERSGTEINSITIKDTTFYQTIQKYTLGKFLDAWQDSKYFMVVAHKP